MLSMGRPFSPNTGGEYVVFACFVFEVSCWKWSIYHGLFITAIRLC